MIEALTFYRVMLGQYEHIETYCAAYDKINPVILKWHRAIGMLIDQGYRDHGYCEPTNEQFAATARKFTEVRNAGGDRLLAGFIAAEAMRANGNLDRMMNNDIRQRG
ncbi:hypothetical protein ACFTSD_02545 [Nocardiaceae bacterium NPDC056970]